MQNALKAGGTYFLLAFAVGFALGTLRTLVIAPATGDLNAVAIELPFMLVVSWIACGWSVRRWRVPAAAAPRALMGFSAFALLMAAETALGVIGFSRTLAEQLVAISSPAGLLGLAAQIGFALFPLIHREDTRP